MTRNLLIADPPWPERIDRRSRMQTAPYLNLPDFPRLNQDDISRLLGVLEAGMDASLVWCVENFLLGELQRTSTLNSRQILIWYKASLGFGWNVRRSHEYIIARWKKGYRTYCSIPSVLIGGRTDHSHLTSKPVEVLVTLIEAFGGKDGKVIEAFRGSPNLERACSIVGCQYMDAGYLHE